MSLNRAVLSDQVKEILLKRILDGEYKPGDRLVEMHLAQEFEISQAPVREALRELEALGFVESEPYRGTRVRAVTKSELTEIYPVRAALEEVAARAAALRLENVEALEAELRAMHAAAEKGDLYEQVKHDVEFHRLIVEASGNRVLQDMWRSLRIEARTLISVLKVGISGDELAEMHRPVLEALAERDGEKAGLLIRKHVEYFGELIMKGDSSDSSS